MLMIPNWGPITRVKGFQFPSEDQLLLKKKKKKKRRSEDQLQDVNDSKSYNSSLIRNTSMYVEG